jgi:DNA-binding MarR family transcriptional regulator
LPVLLRRAWFGLNQVFRRRIAHLGLTPDQFTVMRNLVESDGAGLTQRELAERMGSDPNTITAILERMAAAGLVARQKDDRDRRANRVRLEPSGIARYAEARELALSLQVEVLGTMDAARREVFLEDLERMADACRQAGESTAPGKGAS